MNSGFDLDQPFFRRWQSERAAKQKTGQGLYVTAAQTAAGDEFLVAGFVLQSIYRLVLQYMRSRSVKSCPFTSTSAKNATTNLKPLFTAVRRLHAPNAAASSWRLNFPCLRLRPRGLLRRLVHLLAPAAVAVIRAGRAHALLINPTQFNLW